MPIEFSIIIESYTLNEGGARGRFCTVLRKATAMIPEDGSAEILVMDVNESLELKKLLSEEFPQVRHIPAFGFHYDRAKELAAREASGKFLLYLDGDCIPQNNWHLKLLEALRSNKAVACGGYTRYGGGFLAKFMSIMDFGFFYPLVKRKLQCYASNNIGFLRETYLKVPMPKSFLRCCCFFHAQNLYRRGTPVYLVPDARVLHEEQPIVRERTRQGYDTVAAALADSKLPEAKWLRWGGIFSLPLFYAMNIFLDWKRVCTGRKDLGLSFWQFFLSLPLFPVFRLFDVAGMLRAFVYGPIEDGWGGFEGRS